MSKRTILLCRHFGSNSYRSAGVFDSTYGIADEATRLAVTTATENLRLSLLRHFQRNATQHGGDIYDAMARCGMQP